MRNTYRIDPLLSANLACELSLREEALIGEQIIYLARSFKERIQHLTKDELAYITCLILDAYSKQEGNNYFFESLLNVIEQQLKALQ